MDRNNGLERETTVHFCNHRSFTGLERETTVHFSNHKSFTGLERETTVHFSNHRSCQNKLSEVDNKKMSGMCVLTSNAEVINKC